MRLCGMGSEDGDKISPNVEVEVHDVTMPVPNKVIGPARELIQYRLELALTPEEVAGLQLVKIYRVSNGAG